MSWIEKQIDTIKVEKTQQEAHQTRVTDPIADVPNPDLWGNVRKLLLERNIPGLMVDVRSVLGGELIKRGPIDTPEKEEQMYLGYGLVWISYGLPIRTEHESYSYMSAGTPWGEDHQSSTKPENIYIPAVNLTEVPARVAVLGVIRSGEGYDIKADSVDIRIIHNHLRPTIPLIDQFKIKIGKLAPPVYKPYRVDFRNIGDESRLFTFYPFNVKPESQLTENGKVNINAITLNGSETRLPETEDAQADTEELQKGLIAGLKKIHKL